MSSKVLIIPGYGGSGPAHWQTWLESQLPGSERVQGIDWKKPSLPRWCERVGQAVDAARKPVWLVAHSFGSLVAASVIAHQPSKIAGAILVAPADPQRFAVDGIRDSSGRTISESIAPYLPKQSLGVNGLLVASDNDPWLTLDHARAMASRWELPLYKAGKAGHINTESGFGPWPFLLSLLYAMEYEAASVNTKIVRFNRQRPTHNVIDAQNETFKQTLAYL